MWGGGGRDDTRGRLTLSMAYQRGLFGGVLTISRLLRSMVALSSPSRRGTVYCTLSVTSAASQRTIYRCERRTCPFATPAVFEPIANNQGKHIGTIPGLQQHRPLTVDQEKDVPWPTHGDSLTCPGVCLLARHSNSIAPCGDVLCPP